jgi:transcriptional regulator with XRE-family HTH domain
MLRIKELRIRHGDMSQGELARELGTDQATVSRWEKNQLGMSSASLIKVAKYFNVSVDDLLGVKHEEKETV